MLVVMVPELVMVVSAPLELIPNEMPLVVMVPELVMVLLAPLEEIPIAAFSLVVMVPELVMVLLAPSEAIASERKPLVVMVPKLVMVLLAPLEEIASERKPVVVMHPLLVTVAPGVLEVIEPLHDSASADVLRPPMRAAGKSSRTRPDHKRCGLDSRSTMPSRQGRGARKDSERFIIARPENQNG